jgi:hypothetical protein
MSNTSGRCFRAFRRTKKRLNSQGRPWARPIRTKIPLSLRMFMLPGHGQASQKSVTRDVLAGIVQRYTAAWMAYVKKMQAEKAAAAKAAN